jgi:hypothetical protein
MWMPRRPIAAFVLALSLGPLPALAKRGDPPDPLDRYRWLRELAGSCWRGVDDDGKPADTRCYSIQYGRFVRSTTQAPVPGGAKSAPMEVETVYAWDPRTGLIETFRWSSDGTFRAGEGIGFKEGAFRFEERERDGPSTRHTIWRRIDADTFKVTLAIKKGDAWVDVKTVTYERVPK